MKILSLGAGVQSSALLILAARREIECDGVIFADTGCEKSTTYEYLQELQKIAKDAGLSYQEVRREGGTIEDYCKKYRIIPSTIRRWCTDKFKIKPLSKVLNCEVDEVMIGFSYDEQHRVKPYKLPYKRTFPLIDLKLTRSDCVHELLSYGLPEPTKSSCWMCVFQDRWSWMWLKRTFPELFQKALDLEALYHSRRPHTKETMGLFQGRPLWRSMGEGLQDTMLDDYGCYSGHCFR